MSQYLKRLHISNFDNAEEEIQSHYLKRVDIVEVIDQNGNPWEPDPGLVEWGTISQTISDNPYDPNTDGVAPVSINTPIICAVSVADAPSDLAYEWSKRGADSVLIGTPNNSQTAITFPTQGVFTVTVALKSSQTAEWSSAIFNFMAS